jgi:hypothetical protein
VVIGVAGEIDIATADRLRMQVIIAVTTPSVLINLGEVEFCDSTGLGALVAIWKTIRADGEACRGHEPARGHVIDGAAGGHATGQERAGDRYAQQQPDLSRWRSPGSQGQVPAGRTGVAGGGPTVEVRHRGSNMFPSFRRACPVTVGRL